MFISCQCLLILFSVVFILSKYPVFIISMPLNLISVLYVIPCILSYDFNKLIIFYILIYIYIYLPHFYDKYDSNHVDKKSVCLSYHWKYHTWVFFFKSGHCHSPWGVNYCGNSHLKASENDEKYSNDWTNVDSTLCQGRAIWPNIESKLGKPSSLFCWNTSSEKATRSMLYHNVEVESSHGYIDDISYPRRVFLMIFYF